MHVVVGAYLLSGQPGFRQAGVHYYAKNLLQTLAAGPSPDVGLTTLISPTAAEEFTAAECAALRVRLAPVSTESPFSRMRIEQMELPGELRALGADLYHGLGFVAPLRAPCPTVVSVMDLSFITQPRTHKRVNRLYLSVLTRLSCRRARRVITISAWTKHDVVEHFGIPAERVDAIPLAADHARFAPLPEPERAAFQRTHGIGPASIFYLGSIEPRKNLARLIEAVARLPESTQLFIGGSLAWKYDETLARVKQLGLESRVRLLDRVAPEDLRKWYSACGVFAYPSLYEGFGLPPLEAMACGAAVVTSNAAALPEVVGDAGLLVEPTDTAALAATLGRVLEDGALRQELQARAVKRASLFTWQRVAEQTIASYRRALSG